MEQLSDDQLKTFDMEYVNDILFIPIRERLIRDFPGGRFNFLDIGGGTGRFVDRILDSFPESAGTVLDNSELLLKANNPNPRKKVLLESVEHLGRHPEKYDVVFFNWVLHHLVAKNYSESRENILNALRTVKSLLEPGGRLSVYENMYDGFVIDNLPGRLIYALTSMKTIRKVIRKAGANTAGVGVCFNSRQAWIAMLTQSGFSEPEVTPDPQRILNTKPLYKALLQIRNIEFAHFWTKPDNYI